MSHTPGPWNVCDLDFRVVEAAEKVVADMRTYNPSDAALVAAAPDLLKALETALPYMEGMAEKLSIARNSPEVIHLHEQIINARAALNKAREG